MRYKVKLSAHKSADDDLSPSDFDDLLAALAEHLANSPDVIEHHLWGCEESGDFGVFMIAGNLSNRIEDASVAIARILGAAVAAAGMEWAEESQPPTRSQPAHQYAMLRNYELEPA